MVIVCLMFSILPVQFGSMDHDTGNCILTVTDHGPLGYIDSNQSGGNGFWYPKWVNPTLYYGSQAAGNDATYVIDAYYESYQHDDLDWETVKPIGRHEPPEFGLQEYDCIYNDSGPTSNPKGLECYQYSVADADTNCDDFVIIEYIYTNKGSEPINGLYSAIFMDFDIINATDNYGRTDQSLRTAYMQPSMSNDNPTVGIVYLGSKPQALLPVANLSVIDHAVYVYPYQGLPDDIQWEFMNGNYSQVQANRQYDWSVVVSVGPFDLVPGDSQHVTFAIVGGVSNLHYLENCRHAIEQYDTMWPGITEGEEVRLGHNLRLGPNPTTGRLSINFHLGKPAPVKITLFDLTGRRVAALYDSKIPSSKQRLTLTLPEKLSSGVYFLIFETDGGTDSKKVVLRR